MKQIFKRTSAALLALLLCLSLLSGISLPAQAASVTYVTVNLSGYGQVIKNWGNRGEEATFMSPNGEKFYTNNSTSYDQLANYTGSSNVNNVPSSALYKQLQKLMKDNHDEITSYNDTKELYQYTDCLNSGKTTNKISSFYSGTLIGPSWDGGSTWNREHTWPNSKGLNGSDENDIMMLRPTSKSENSSRGNTAYGESSGYYNPNKESGGKYNLHGDVARIMLYQYVRWGNTNMWGTGGVMENKTVLLKWMEEDPVDTWELGRNDAVESITGTRNVFVDYPELAFLLFDADIPTDMVTPSGEASNSAGYTITAQSSNNAHGTVTVSGKTINAVPATGYEVAGYTILSGTAQVVRTGNTFAVTATADCTIRINFAARTQKTVEFSENGGVVDTKKVYSGDDIVLPSHSTQVQTGYTFMGWVDHTVAETPDAPVYYTAGSQYTVASDVTLYALYAMTKDGSGVNSNVFQPYSGTLTEGDYIIVSSTTSGDYGDFALKAADLNGRLNFSSVTYTGTDIVTNDGMIIWHIAPSGSAWTIYNASTGSYAGGTGIKNKAALLSSVDDFAKWTSRNTGSEYEFINVGNAAKNVNPRLRYNGSVGFACYADSTSSVGVPLKLYKRASGAAYYFTMDEQSSLVAGDMNSDGVVSDSDAVYLLRHTLFKDEFPLPMDGDVNSDGVVSDADAVYLLRHSLFKNEFPLYP